MTTHHTAAAWVPLQADHEFSDFAEPLAIEWLDDTRSTDDGAPAVVLNTLNSGAGGPLSEYASRHRATSNRSRRRTPHGPVIAFVPDLRSLEFAVGLARRRPIVVIEGSTDVSGWAVATGAVNLLEPAEPPATYSDEVAEVLERLRFHGNNRWNNPPSRSAAARCVEALRTLGFDDWGAVKSWMVAHGMAGDAFGELDRLT